MSHSLAFDNSVYMDTSLDNSCVMASNCPPMDNVYGNLPNLMSVQQYTQQPYLDHSYATLLSSSSNSVEVASVPVVADSVEPLAAYIDIEDVSCNTTVVTAPMGRDASDDSNEGDPWEGSVTRCICDFQHDDGYMICCDRCGVWQHVDCMGVDRNNIPESYLCELCLPRFIDKRRAIRLQTIKKEQMESEASETDSSSDDTHGGRGSGRKRPGRRRLDGRSNALPGRAVKRRTTSEPSEEKPNGKRNRQMSEQKPVGSRGPRRQSSSESYTRTKRNSAFDAQQNVTIDHSVEDVCHNSYTNGVRILLMSVKDSEMAAGKMTASTPSNPSLLKEQISKQRFHIAQFSPDAKGIAAREMIRVNQAVAEYTGKLMLAEEYENQSGVFAPFVLNYAGLHGVSLCIDSSLSGNEARHIRCSCTPNAKVVHIVEQNAIRFFICATKNISEGREVTIPFHFDYQKCNTEVLCACGRASCQVARFFKQKSSSRPIRVRRSAASLSAAEQKSQLTASEALDNGKGLAAASVVRQTNSRRSTMSSELNKVVSSDVGADITLMNALTANSSSAAFGSAASLSSRSTICSTDGQANGSYAGHLVNAEETRPMATASTTRSGLAQMKEAAKAEKGKKPPGSGRNRNQPLPENSVGAGENRLATARSNRLRDRAQQMANTLSRKD